MLHLTEAVPVWLYSRVVTQHRTFLLRSVAKDPASDLYEWLYAMNPLLAGQIRSVVSRVCIVIMWEGEKDVLTDYRVVARIILRPRLRSSRVSPEFVLLFGQGNI